MALPDDAVHVWWTDCDDPAVAASLGAYRGLLAPDEEARYRQFRHAGAQREHLVARALVRCVLSRYCPVAPADWRFQVSPEGRPLVAAPPGPTPHFSLSHSHGRVVCATAWVPVGVDTEPADRGSQVLDLAADVFSIDERRALADLPLPGQADRAVALWTLKEAFVKALGTGLATAFPTITLLMDGTTPRLGDPLPPTAGTATDWQLASLDLAGHRMAIAVRRGAIDRHTILIRPLVPLAG
jgi:4'-phosphopantetheinyl transferase